MAALFEGITGCKERKKKQNKNYSHSKGLRPVLSSRVATWPHVAI